MSKQEKSFKELWAELAPKTNIDNKQIELFEKYAKLLIFWNEKFNLTAIVEPKGIIQNHFLDSLKLADAIDLSKVNFIVDVGTGAGFPAIPLKIAFPHLKILLLEVNNKKRNFLAEVINSLNLENVEICELDFRTFLRITEADTDLFVSRASLDLEELSRMFKPSSTYRNAKLVYFASDNFEVPENLSHLISEIKPYIIGHKKRKLVILESQKR